MMPLGQADNLVDPVLTLNLEWNGFPLRWFGSASIASALVSFHRPVKEMPWIIAFLLFPEAF